MQNISRFSLMLFSLLAIHTGLQAQSPGGTPRPVVTPVTAPGVYTNPLINFVRTWEPSMPTTDPATVTHASRNTKEVKQTTLYVDGLGRPLQTVSKGISGMSDPNEVTGFDMVSPVVYDAFGREVYKYLPYVANAQDGKFRTNPFTEQYGVLQTQYSNENVFYSKTDYEASPLNRVQKSMAPGNSWAGSNRGASQEYLVNAVADGVRIWTIGATAGSVPASTGIYAGGELYKNASADESGNKVVEYKDKEGQVILKKVQIVAVPGVDHSGWLCTYYVYDDLNNLRYVLPPKTVEELVTNGWSLADATFRNELCFWYEYDHRRRMIIKQVPGAQPVEMVYDVRDRLVFVQDGNIRPAGKWLTTLYDELNRPVMTGLYTTSQTRTQLESALAVATTTQTIVHNIPIIANLVAASHDGRLIYKARTSIEFTDGFDSGLSETETVLDPNGVQTTETIYANNPLPALTAGNLEPLTYTYYDKHDYPGKKDAYTADFGKPEEGNNPYKETVAVSSMTKGLVTGNKVRILGTDEWLTTSTYYDEKGRVQQVLGDNAEGGEDIVTNLYDFNGKVLSSYLRHRNPRSGQTPETRILTMMQYDHAGRLLKVTKRVNDNTSLQRDIAIHEYDALGQLKKKTFKQLNGIDELESLKYEYTVRGWLSGINKKYFTGEEAHYFGQELSYDAGFTNKEYNGNIAGIKWKAFNDAVSRAYGYSYDGANRLLKADFTQLTGGNWDQSAGVNYNVKMGDGAIGAYDANGNIMRMQQWGLTGPSSSGQLDDLQYGYNGLSNKLKAVTDEQNNAASTLGDFKEIVKGEAEDYNYDPNGNLTRDGNKGITQITYNHLNLPELITITGKGTIRYAYDAAGIKHRKTVTDNTGSTTKVTTTSYVGGMVYEQDSMQFISHEEGRIRLVYASAQPVGYTYDYFIKDHLGNIRTVLTEQSQQGLYLASMEQERAATENALFSNIDASRSTKPAGYPQDKSAGAENGFVAKLNGNNPDKRVGPSLVLKVMAGDTISIGARAFYKSIGAKQDKRLLPASDMATALVRAFGGTSGGSGDKVTAGQPGERSPFNEQFINDQYQRLKEREPESKLNDNRPRAYLNFALFDDQFNLVEENSGVKQVKAQPDELQVLEQGKMVMKKGGFLYVYTSNETPQDVFFDNLIVMNAPGPVLEETHYYPFGLTMSGISSKAVGPLENRYKYNGIERIGDLGLEDYDAKFRELDPQIGRWWEIDPKTESMEMWSPYASNYDNPIRFNDFLGDKPGPDEPGLLTSLMFAALGSVNAYVSNNAMGAGRTSVEQTGLTGNLAIVYQIGQKVGDAASTITGAGEVTAAAGSEVATAGVASPLAIPVALHGALTTIISAKNLFSPIKNIEGNNSGGQYTEPTLPPKTVADNGKVRADHYTRSGDHGPPHLHVKGGGKETKIGQNGKPIEGSPELTTAQKQFVQDFKKDIRKAVDKIGKWFNYNNKQQ